MLKRDSISQFLYHFGAISLSIIVIRFLYFVCHATSSSAKDINFYDFSQITSITYNRRFLLGRDVISGSFSESSPPVYAQSLAEIYPKNIVETINRIEISEACKDSNIQTFGDSSAIVCANGSIVFLFSPSFDLNGFGGGSFDKATTSVMILSQEYQWLFSSTTEVEGSSGLGLLPVEKRIEEEAIQKWIQSSSAIAAVGTASYEGNLKRENDRAAVRSTEVYDLLLSLLARYQTAKSLFKLNLGQYDSDKCSVMGADTTGYQRPIIILGILTDSEKPDFLSLRQVQRAVDQLERNPLPNLDLWCYSNFPSFEVGL